MADIEEIRRTAQMLAARVENKTAEELQVAEARKKAADLQADVQKKKLIVSLLQQKPADLEAQMKEIKALQDEEEKLSREATDVNMGNFLVEESVDGRNAGTHDSPILDNLSVASIRVNPVVADEKAQPQIETQQALMLLIQLQAESTRTLVESVRKNDNDRTESDTIHTMRWKNERFAGDKRKVILFLQLFDEHMKQYPDISDEKMVKFIQEWMLADVVKSRWIAYKRDEDNVTVPYFRAFIIEQYPANIKLDILRRKLVEFKILANKHPFDAYKNWIQAHSKYELYAKHVRQINQDVIDPTEVMMFSEGDKKRQLIRAFVTEPMDTTFTLYYLMRVQISNKWNKLAAEDKVTHVALLNIIKTIVKAFQKNKFQKVYPYILDNMEEMMSGAKENRYYNNNNNKRSFRPNYNAYRGKRQRFNNNNNSNQSNRSWNNNNNNNQGRRSWNNKPAYQTPRWNSNRRNNNNNKPRQATLNYNKGRYSNNRTNTKCGHCHQPGHARKDCKAFKALQRSCYNCGQPGHFRIECTKPKKQSSYQNSSIANTQRFTNNRRPNNSDNNRRTNSQSLKCYNCNQFGHLARNCNKAKQQLFSFQGPNMNIERRQDNNRNNNNNPYTFQTRHAPSMQQQE